ncbi:hypothetical protein C5167_012741 [Papaver somniferum]|uniref:Translation elongation factor EFG/EF2 domain-containing protein n=1 Tax=Papaver somniferum TaxID=3469 RepID=A0A4Y7J1G0_PAPSO|nr:hypothetical protein C5167_012741 [Papaver somniferum]
MGPLCPHIRSNSESSSSSSLEEDIEEEDSDYIEMVLWHQAMSAQASDLSHSSEYSVKNLYVGPLDDQYANAIRNCDPEGEFLRSTCLRLFPAFDQGRFFAFGHVFAGEVATGAKFPWLDWIITKNATLTKKKKKEVYAHPIRAMKFSVSPVSGCLLTAVSKLVEELTHLSKSDPMVVCMIKELGEHIIAEKSLRTVMSQSPNKHNRWYLEACSFEGAIDDGLDTTGPNMGKDLAKNIWCFGPDTTGPNMVVDMCEGVQYLNEIKESVVAGSQWASKEGVLAEENMIGICFEVCDLVLHSDAIHRGGGQVIPSRYPGSEERSWWYLWRGHVFVEMQRPGTPLYNMKAYLLVIESFGFSAQLSLPHQEEEEFEGSDVTPPLILRTSFKSKAYVYRFFKKKRIVLYGTLIQQAASVAPQVAPSLRQGVSGIQPQQLYQPPHQPSSKLSQVLSRQMQALQASFQSSQKTFSQLQKRLHMMRQSGQNLSRQLDAQATKLQVTAGQTVSISLASATAAAVPGFSTTAATTPALSPLGGQVALPPCNWTEHSSPEGYKYYYNSATIATTGSSYPTRPSITRLATKSASQVIKFAGSRFRLSSKCSAWDCGNLVMLNHSQFRCCPARFHQGLQAHEWEWKSKSIT